MTALRRVALLAFLTLALVPSAALALDAAEPHGAVAMLFGVLVPVWATALLLGSMLGRALDELS